MKKKNKIIIKKRLYAIFLNSNILNNIGTSISHFTLCKTYRDFKYLLYIKQKKNN